MCNDYRKHTVMWKRVEYIQANGSARGLFTQVKR